MQQPESSRRDFFQSLFGSALAASLAEQVVAQTQSSANGIPTRPFGRTKERVSIIALGGAHAVGAKDKNEATRIIQTAVDEGITFFDNAWEYADGKAEEFMGEALAADGRRNKIFLMTKNCERDYAGSMRCLEDSLRRLRTDRLDLWQFHECNYDSDPDWVFEKGAVKAALEAKKAGKVRFIGFTGHKSPHIHLKMLGKDQQWDSAQMPINVMDALYRSFQKQVLPVCLKKGVAVLGMKGLGGGRPSGKIPREGKVSVDECLRYSLSTPVTTQIVGFMAMEHLMQAVQIARNFKPMPDAEKTKLLARIKDEAEDGRHELFKSAQPFDSPHHRRQHGFATS
jgi:predicted aldo/keto reductase-like oxidoreductase